MFDWNSKFIDKHRRGISDMEWANKQPRRPPNYMIGDVIEFMVGGIGVVDEVNYPISKECKILDGWPVEYSVKPIKGKPFHKRGVHAWHYEGDIKQLVAGSGIRQL